MQLILKLVQKSNDVRDDPKKIDKKKRKIAHMRDRALRNPDKKCRDGVLARVGC